MAGTQQLTPIYKSQRCFLQKQPACLARDKNFPHLGRNKMLIPMVRSIKHAVADHTSCKLLSTSSKKCEAFPHSNWKPGSTAAKPTLQTFFAESPNPGALMDNSNRSDRKARSSKLNAASLDALDMLEEQAEETDSVGSLRGAGVSRVYIILVPLTLPNGLLRTAVDFTSITFKQRMEHAMTLVEGPDGKCVCFDFRPVDPDNPKVCFTLLTGRTSPGILRQSRLSRLPKKNCWLVGESRRSIKEAIEFHNHWDSKLHLLRNNCYTHTDALVEHLTGQPKILETLKLGAQKRLVQVFPSKKGKPT